MGGVLELKDMDEFRSGPWAEAMLARPSKASLTDIFILELMFCFLLLICVTMDALCVVMMMRTSRIRQNSFLLRSGDISSSEWWLASDDGEQATVSE